FVPQKVSQALRPGPANTNQPNGWALRENLFGKVVGGLFHSCHRATQPYHLTCPHPLPLVPRCIR
ncbi:hypothetical protein, partial [Halomonas alkaliantarctica]|uniref:hypothetical protein n=1 Tax=Halomonas alkaliantarctica TaxID=232346 RepID=UPI000551DFA3